MTPEERAMKALESCVDNGGAGLWPEMAIVQDVANAIRTAVSEEREQCEKLVIEVLNRHDIWHGAPQACISVVRELVPKVLRISKD